MMQVSISASAGRGLPPTAARRIAKFGFGATVSREGLVRALKTRRAADLFINTWSRRGMLVPLAWGSYWIPDERTASLVLAARAPHQGALLSTAAALRGPLRLGRPAGFMGPAIWGG